MKDSDIEDVGGCLFTVLMVPASVLLRVWVVVCGWGWFIVPLGVPAIDGFHAYGLGTLALLFQRTSSWKDTKQEEDWVLRKAMTSVLVSLLALGFMFVAHSLQGIL